MEVLFVSALLSEEESVASRPRFGGDSQAFSWYRPAGKVQLDRDQLDRKGLLMSISIRALPR